jgi:hypothetical protein
MPVAFWINTISIELCGSNFIDHSRLKTQRNCVCGGGPM